MLSCIHFAIGCLNIFMKNQWMENRDPTEYYMAFRVKAIKFQNKTKQKSNKACIWQKKRPTAHWMNERRKKTERHWHYFGQLWSWLLVTVTDFIGAYACMESCRLIHWSLLHYNWVFVWFKCVEITVAFLYWWLRWTKIKNRFNNEICCSTQPHTYTHVQHTCIEIERGEKYIYVDEAWISPVWQVAGQVALENSFDAGLWKSTAEP